MPHAPSTSACYCTGNTTSGQASKRPAANLTQNGAMVGHETDPLPRTNLFPPSSLRANRNTLMPTTSTETMAAPTLPPAMPTWLQLSNMTDAELTELWLTYVNHADNLHRIHGMKQLPPRHQLCIHNADAILRYLGHRLVCRTIAAKGKSLTPSAEPIQATRD